MELESWVVTNGYTFALLLLLFFVNRTPGRHMNTHAVTYNQLLLMVMGLLIADTLGRLPHAWYTKFWAFFGTYFVFAFDSVGYYFAVRYIESWIEGDRRLRDSIIRNLLILYSAINVILVTFAQIAGTGWFYSFPDDVYTRGPLFLPRGIGNLLFCVAVEAYIIMRRRHINAAYRPAFYCFPVFVLIGGFMQIAFRGIQFEYAGTAMALLLLYTQAQLKDADEDFLTGAVSRRLFESVLQERIKSKKPFGGIMIDIDYFKSINDNFGHSEGDKALRETARLLKGTFPKKSVVSRFGGDEFMILLDDADQEGLTADIARLYEAVERENNRHNLRPYRLQLSAGGVLWTPNPGDDMDAFLKKLDEAMYREKEAHHAAR